MQCSVLQPTAPRGPTALNWYRLAGSSAALATAQAARTRQGPVVAVAVDARTCQRLEAELRFYADGTLPVLPFPDWECLPYDVFSPHQDIVSQRLRVLHRLPTLERGVVLLSVNNLMQRLPPSDYVQGHGFAFRLGDPLRPEALRRHLHHSGYGCVGQVMEPGEFAVRGGVIDLFPMGTERPIRLELLDDAIESIRYFDPETQRSQEKTDAVRLLPAREFPMTEDGIRRFRRHFRACFEGDPTRIRIYREVSEGHVPAGLEFYFPLFFEQTATLFEYLPDNALFVLEDGLEEAATRFEEEVRQRHESASLDRDRPPLPPDALFLDCKALAEALGRFARVHCRRWARAPAADGIHYATRPAPTFHVDLARKSPYETFLEYLRGFPGRVLLVAETPGRREALVKLLHEHGIYPTDCAGWSDFIETDTPLAVTVGELEHGLWLTAPPLGVITESQLYGERVYQRRRRSRAARDPEAVIRSLAELRVGDPVVHEEHGVGRYRGLCTLSVAGMETEFLALEYRGGDRLYIPVLALHLVSRYTSPNPERAPLHGLGTREWERAKARAAKKVHDVAAELLEIQALRVGRQGYAFPAPDELYVAFATRFPFEETPDQARAIEEVLADMASARPMDRLVCGDVGFGKTEVALRAAFLAVQAGRQVAVLVPTTLLAQQHDQVFTDRFADLPVRIELLSRFRTPAQLDEVLAGLRAGRVDIVIGTHRLLQPDVGFKNLGLVIIDEEHRFGVRQKEQLKRLRARVDVLTLTATPIPRTMNMAIAGLRDVSVIATPPKKRLSIRTFLTEWSDALIREACLREIRRGGQIYFLHNNVRTIERVAERLRALLPEAEIGVAHGQMPERQLERIMRDFYHQRFNLLVCTTIIESGIDIPSANTIVIDRADRFGLAQLHQLRGRVGRSHHRAYAYLIIPPRQVLGSEACKRLEAIATLDELGAGFALAAHDLEIRGAGELLGEAQSGVMDEIGYGMYMDLLQRAIASLKAGELGAPAVSGGPRRAEINLHMPVLFPQEYIPDVHTRLVMYKRLANADGAEALADLRAETIDRFGPLPPAAATLFDVTALQIRTVGTGIERIDVGPAGGYVLFAEHPNVDPAAIVRMIQAQPHRFRMDGTRKLRLLQESTNGSERIRLVGAVLDALNAPRH